MSAALGLYPAEPPARVWLLAAACVTLLHAGFVAAALWRAAPAEMDEENSAPIVLEMADSAMAPPEPKQDGDPGVDSDESVQQQVTQQKMPEPVKAESLDAPESLVRVEPDLEFAKKTPEKKDVKATPQEAPLAPDQSNVESQASAHRVAASPSFEAASGPVLAAPISGSAQQIARATKNWQNKLLSHLNTHKKYPEAARANRNTGEAHVRILIDRSGQVLQASIVKSTGLGVLDEEVMAMLKRANPVPNVPIELSGETIELVVPVRFRAKDS